MAIHAASDQPFGEVKKSQVNMKGPLARCEAIELFEGKLDIQSLNSLFGVVTQTLGAIVSTSSFHCSWALLFGFLVALPAFPLSLHRYQFLDQEVRSTWYKIETTILANEIKAANPTLGSAIQQYVDSRDGQLAMAAEIKAAIASGKDLKSIDTRPLFVHEITARFPAAAALFAHPTEDMNDAGERVALIAFVTYAEHGFRELRLVYKPGKTEWISYFDDPVDLGCLINWEGPNPVMDCEFNSVDWTPQRAAKEFTHWNDLISKVADQYGVHDSSSDRGNDIGSKIIYKLPSCVIELTDFVKPDAEVRLWLKVTSKKAVAEAQQP